MSDIVERLRKIAGDDYHGQLEREAADEIDRLRDILRNIERALAAFTVESDR